MRFERDSGWKWCSTLLRLLLFKQVPTRRLFSHSWYHRCNSQGCNSLLDVRNQSVECYQFRRPWVIPNGVSRSQPFWSQISQNYGESYYRTVIGNHTQAIERYHFQWPWVTSDPDFKVMTFLEVGYLQKLCILGTKLPLHTNRKKTIPYISNGIIFGDLDVLWSGRSRGPSSMSVPNLKRISLFVPKL